jgi:AcrR family transcriptional regulator
MSRVRTRPTRDETRHRLLAAAADVIERRGVAAATIEDICEAAGFSRGAFYSNFRAKDEIVLALLDQHLNESLSESLSETERLFDRYDDPEQFILAMESPERQRNSALGFNPMLYMELTLFALRNPANRTLLVERQRSAHARTKRIIELIAERLDVEIPGGAADAATLIMAFDTGLSMHALIDPESCRPTQFSDTVLTLHRLWTS